MFSIGAGGKIAISETAKPDETRVAGRSFEVDSLAIGKKTKAWQNSQEGRERIRKAFEDAEKMSKIISESRRIDPAELLKPYF